jgi:hypothetical protein
MNTSALSDWMIERSFKSLVQLRNSSERERIINYLAFFLSTLLNYAKTFPSGNALRNTNLVSGPAMIN